MTREHVFTFIAPFGGSGLGAYGFQQAEVRLPGLGVSARWELLGGVDIDPHACADFEYLTGVRQLCADVLTLTPADLRREFGERAPHCVFTSAPCTGASGLLSAAKAATPKYQKMNNLALVWTELMLAAWADDPPALMLFENVPRLVARAPEMIASLRKLLKRAGYVQTDGYHDCGELGGMAQHRRRWLLVGRRPKRCPPVLYQPPRRRVRGCGTVLETVPMPGTPAAKAFGRMHELPRLSWLNWVRLSLIPAGGDWRDLEGVLATEQARREVFKRHAVENWDEPVGTIAADSGSNGVANVADPRIAKVPEWYGGTLGVQGWDDASCTVTGAAAPTRGAFSVADPRLGCEPRSGVYGVQEWTKPGKAVTGWLRIDNGPAAVADPRIQLNLGPSAHNNLYRIHDWEKPVPTVTGAGRPGQGAASAADPRAAPFLGLDPEVLRVKGAFDKGYAVLRWQDAASTIAGISSVGCGAYSVADPRIDDAPPDGGVWSGDPKARPPFIPVIIAADNTWHRPLTTLELALLQGFPLRVRGAPLQLSGNSHTLWRRGIGNAVPAPAATAIGERFLVALTEGALGAFSLSPDAVWVQPEAEAS